MLYRIQRFDSGSFVWRVSRQCKEVTIGSIGANHVQIEVLESVTRVHLPHSVMRHLHEQLLCPGSVVRRVVFLLARQTSLRILCSSPPHRTPTQLRLLLLHRLPVRSLWTTNGARDLVPQTTRLEGTLIAHVQHSLRKHTQLSHVQEQLLLPVTPTPLTHVLLRRVRQVERLVPLALQVVDHLPVVRDNRGHSVVVAAEHRFPVELDVGAVAGLLALQHQLVDELHPQRAEEETGAREGGDDGVVLE